MKRTADVLIPVYHPGKELEQLLSLLEAQDYPVNRIILMNTGGGLFSGRNSERSSESGSASCDQGGV